MKAVDIYSLAIQALHERIDRIRRTSGDQTAIDECIESILYLEVVRNALLTSW